MLIRGWSRIYAGLAWDPDAVLTRAGQCDAGLAWDPDAVLTQAGAV